MRKLIMFNLMALDGFFEGPGRDIEWHNVDEEFNQFAVEQLDAAGGLLFGRVTYELMAGYWPTASDDVAVAARMNELPKFVFSRTLEKAEWTNTTLVRDDAVGAVVALKRQPGRDLLLLGSADLAATLIQHRLIDEFRIIVAPLVLAGGNRLFRPPGGRLDLHLLSSRTFGNGNVLLVYAPA